MKWLEGKKTYLAAAGLLGLALGGFWFDLFGRPEASALILMALGLVGIGHKIDRQVEMLLNLVEFEKQKRGSRKPVVGSQLEDAGAEKVERELKYEPVDKTGEGRD